MINIMFLFSQLKVQIIIVKLSLLHQNNPYILCFCLTVLESVQGDGEDSQPQNKRRCCTACKKPMKCHKEVLDCPRNQKN